ncbi:fructose-bisphosphate aldolase-lysine N-methyltransferase, chloroplastic-like [Zingiber officinale]|uniref:fructose-bisphosphate aldolase-lysine N-methyltransferase, chloroplastic-like n=1 Tax=Zingiber officinale TaxID=94328 RepID=UPI001C4A95B3|nr:fructose-bisphosphate aldolase-lysine N-methyltransferase, chloroplastic-like [Zingiber officinale]
MALPRFLPHSSSCLLSPLHNPWPLSLLNAAGGRRIVDGSAVRVRIRGSLAPPESAVADFWQWMSKKGAVSASSAVVKPGFVPEGLGLVAQRDIPRNEVVVEIPKSLWIDADTVAASEIGRLCGGLRPWVAIALFLLREKALGQASPWHPYLNILPTTTNSTLFWPEGELSEIQGTQLLSTTIGAKDYVESEFTKVEGEVILPNKDLFPSAITLPDFLWAFGMLRSRAFSRLRGENLALVPLADLINHSSNITVEESSWEIKGKGLFSRELIFSLRTPAYLKSGEQVYIQFDMGKSNADLALDYGFVDPRPDRDAYTLTLEISESDPFYGDKLDIAESNGLAETAYFDVVQGHTLPPLMLPYLRLVALGGTDAFLLESIFRNSVWDHLELPVSRANEETICRVVRDACKSALSGYGTTIEEDEKLMERGNLGERLGIAVRIRVGEKKLLRQIDDAFRDRESELDGLEYYQERRLKDLGLVGEQGEIIFWETK